MKPTKSQIKEYHEIIAKIKKTIKENMTSNELLYDVRNYQLLCNCKLTEEQIDDVYTYFNDLLN